ncbi:MAG: bifunctional nicotinamide-nucleotide adenylyltransferase/Nudix hydroxylase [Nevskia sp.]|nr:bifunctional nicotinamide-nucleotide adenylyltransferase/Nudix hydroxylase [Nevskia sp.]
MVGSRSKELTAMRYDLLVFIGRFQPFHQGHLAVLRQALAETRHLLILVGSAHRPRSTRDPFSADERALMIRACFADAADDLARITIAPLDDVMYNDTVWIRNVQRAVSDCAQAIHPEREEAELRIGLVGHGKDRTSYYLRMFPAWGSVDVASHEGISATEVRGLYFTQPFESGHVPAAAEAILAGRLPPQVCDWLRRFAAKPAYAELKAEQEFVDKYRSQFAALKYPAQHHTADAVVIQSGHILLVRRGARPGLGQLALPGGFVRPEETTLDAAIRELREETRLKVPEPVLRGSLSGKDQFDDPHRSTRGRTFTSAFRFDLRAETELPKVKGGDDAKEAFWLPLARLRPEEMFEDHYFIIQKMVGL